MEILLMPTTVRRSRLFACLTSRAARLALGLGLAGWMLSANAFFSLGMIPGIYIPQTYYKFGAVYTRAIVPGPGGRPVYVEYGTDGKEAREIGEAVGQYERAKVMPSGSYRSLLQRLKDSQERYPEQVVMKAADYKGQSFQTAGGETITKPDLAADTLTVVVRPDKQRFLKDGKDLLLLELPIDTNNQPSSSSKALLLSDKGEILHQTDNSIGFRVGFFGKDGKVADSRYRRPGKDDIYGALPSVGVTLGGWVSGGYAITDDQGKFVMNYFLPACPGFTFDYTTNIYLELYYKRFNPRSKSHMPYYMSRPGYDFCFGLGVYSLDAMMIGLSIAMPVKQPDDFPIDLMVLDGGATLKNAKLGAKTAYNAETSDYKKQIQEKYDFDGDEKPDWVAPGKKVKKTIDGKEKEVFVTTAVEQAELQGIYLSSHYDAIPADTETTAPDFTRLVDTAADFKDRGLLSTISKDDLRDTDIYVFRESNGQLVAERRGLHENELYKNLSGVDEQEGSFRYTIHLRGATENFYTIGYERGEAGFKKWQSAGGFKEEFQKRTANHLKAGETVRIIAINRPTGYMGSVRVPLQTATATGNFLNFPGQRIELAPPNLKLWAERKSKIEQGMTKGEDRKQLIGSEGAGLGSDVSIAIYSDWRDQDGSPLPEELADYGYTGRLAKIVAENQLAPSGVNNLSQFKIKPGQQVQVIQLPEKILAKQHLYLQVAGQPDNRNPDFASGAGTGILKYRPNHYVPVKVPLHDEEASEISRQAYRKAAKEKPELKLKKPDPIYTWKYRPEMQFSLYELNVKEVRRIDAAGAISNVYKDKFPVLSGADSYTGIIYNLIKSSFNALDAFSYKGQREVVLSIGAQEIKATVGESQNIKFENIENLDRLDGDDFLSLRLYANNDTANVLWEYAFNTISMFPGPSKDVPYLELSADEAEGVVFSAAYLTPPKEPTGVKWGVVSDSPVVFTPEAERNASGVFKTLANLPTKAGSLVKVYAANAENPANKFYTVAYKVVAGAPYKVTVKSTGKTAITGFGEVSLDLDVKDRFGNPVADQTPIGISSADMTMEGQLYTVGGKSTIRLKGGFLAGEQNVTVKVGSVVQSLAIMVHDITLAVNIESNIDVGATVPVTITASSSYGDLVGLPISVSTIRAAIDNNELVIGSSNTVTFNAYVGDFIGEGRIFASVADNIVRKDFNVIDNSNVQLLDRVIVSGVAQKGSFMVEGTKYEYTPATAVVISGAQGETYKTSFLDYLAPPMLAELNFSLQQDVINQKISDDIIGLPADVTSVARVASRFEQLMYAYELTAASKVVIDYDNLKSIDNLGVVFNFKFAHSGQLLSFPALGLRLFLDDASQLVLSRTEGDKEIAVTTAPLMLNSWHKIGAHYINGELVLQVDKDIYKSDKLLALTVKQNSAELIVGTGVAGQLSELAIFNWDAEKIISFDDNSLSSSVTIGPSGKAILGIKTSSNNLFASINQRRYDYWKDKLAPSYLAAAYAAEDSCKPIERDAQDVFGYKLDLGASYAGFLADCNFKPKLKQAFITITSDAGAARKAVAIAEFSTYTLLYTQFKLAQLSLTLGPQCIAGAVTGNVDSVGSAVCDIITSFFAIGNLRDFALQSKYLYYDGDVPGSKYNYPVYLFSGLGLASNLLSLVAVGIPENIGLAGAKVAAKLMVGPFMKSFAAFVFKEMGGSWSNLDKLAPALKKTLPLMQLTAGVIILKDEVPKAYDAISQIKAEQIVGVLNYAVFALKQLELNPLAYNENPQDNAWLALAYAIDGKTLIAMLGGSEKAGAAIEKLLISMNNAQARVGEAGTLISAKSGKHEINKLFIGGIDSFGKNIGELTNPELIKIVTDSKFLTALIVAQHVGSVAGKSSQEIIDSIRRLHCTSSDCGWGAGGMLKFFSLFDKIAVTHAGKFGGSEAEINKSVGSLSEMIRDMGRQGQAGLGHSKGATEALIQMTKKMDEGWTLVSAEARALGDVNNTHIYDLVMTKGGITKHLEVKNWQQLEEGRPIALNLWSSMIGVAESEVNKAGQLHFDLVRIFRDPAKIDVAWIFGNRAGAIEKIQEDLLALAVAKPQRLLIILKEAKNAELIERLEKIMGGKSKETVADFMKSQFKPVLDKMLQKGATLEDAAKI